jgi:hypothetical protein
MSEKKKKTTTRIKKELFKILTKMNVTQTPYGKRYDNRPHDEIINDICSLFEKETQK